MLCELREAGLGDQRAEPTPNHADRLSGVRAGVGQHQVHSPEQGLVQDGAVVGGGDHERGRAGILQEHQERVEDPAGLADVVAGAIGAERVELVEQVHAAAGVDLVEDLAQLARGLAHVLAHQRVETDGEHRQRELVGQHRGGHRLAGAGRALQEQPVHRGEAAVEEPLALPLFRDDVLELVLERAREHQVAQARAGVRGEDQVGKVAARLAERGDVRSGRWPRGRRRRPS